MNQYIGFDWENIDWSMRQINKVILFLLPCSLLEENNIKKNR